MAGGKRTLYRTIPVTLNSFQGPFLGAGRSVFRQPGRAASALSAANGLAARWTLKQVQGDGEIGEAP